MNDGNKNIFLLLITTRMLICPIIKARNIL